MKKVFIGIRTYNSEKYLNDCFQSVWEQDYPKMHIVVFDDKSSDGTIDELNKWKNAFADRGVQFEIVQNSENGGCGQSFERMGRLVAAKIDKDDIFVMLDSDDKFTSDKTISNCVFQMEKNKADVLIAGFNLTGDMDLVLNWNAGNDHNTLSKNLAEIGSTTIEQTPNIAQDADSIGWTKIVRGNVFKRYMQMYPVLSKEMSVCEDFLSLAQLLLRKNEGQNASEGVKITGLSEHMYEYTKHAQSSTATVKADDFRVIRLGFLQSLQEMVTKNKEQFIGDAEKYVNKFIATKYKVIRNIIDKKNKSGALEGYTSEDWDMDFSTKIDCSKLGIKIPNQDIAPSLCQAIITNKTK